MNTLSLYTAIRNSLPESDWNTVTSSLKFNPIIWNSLQNPQFLEKLQLYKLREIIDWFPANLGLISINFKVPAQEICKTNLPVLDDHLSKKAMNSIEKLKVDTHILDLEDSTLIALFIRDKLIQAESWFSIRTELPGNRSGNKNSVFVCLYGLLNNPDDFLEDCLSIDNSLENYLLILHTLLANPIDSEQRVDILTRLLARGAQNHSLSILDILKFFQYLSLIRPELAARVSKPMLDHLNSLPEKVCPQHITVIDNLHAMELNLLNAELQKLSNSSDGSIQHVNNALSSLVNMLANLAPEFKEYFLDLNSQEVIEEEYNILANKRLLENLISQEDLVNHPLQKTNSLLCFIENRQYEEAEQFIDANEGFINSGFIKNLVRAINAHNRGDEQRSIEYARIAAADIFECNADFEYYISSHTESLIIPFIELLIDIDLVQEAVLFAHKAISLRQLDIKLNTIFGEAFIADFRPNDAAEAYYTAMLLKPEDLDIRRCLATCLEEIGVWHEAYTERKHILDEIQKINTNPDLADLHKLSECAIKIGLIDEAIKLCEQAISLDDETGYSYSLIGKALINNNDTDAAFEQFEKGIQLSPQDPETWLSLAEAQLLAENTKGAVGTLQAALQAIPTSVAIHLALGELQLSQNALTEALTTFKRGAEIEPNNTQIAMKLGSTLQLLGHFPESEQVLESAHLRAPNHVGVAHAYAKSLLQLGDKVRAIPLLNIVVKSKPEGVDPYLEFAEALLSSNLNSVEQYSLDDVLSALNRALEFDPTNPISHALLGETLSLNGDYIAAKKAYQVALESNLIEEDEWFARLSLGMGRVALALGQEDVALASLQEALQVDPDNSQIHRAICEVYQAVNLPEDALQSARAALNLAIDDIDTLAWYADQMVRLSDMEAFQESQSPTLEFLKQLQSEALNALHTANQIAPQRVDLLVKLGRIQAILGENDNAVATLNSLIDNEYANANDLITGGRLLAELGDSCGAIASLERAYSKISETSTDTAAELLIQLARLYRMDGDNMSALQALNRAGENNSNFAPIYYARAELLLELNNEDEALACISEGLKKAIDENSQMQLHILASNVLRKRGDLKLALDHAQEGLALCGVDTISPNLRDGVLSELITLASGLFQASLKPNRSRLLFKEMERKYKIDTSEDLDYCCSFIELFLDDLSDDELTTIVSQMIEVEPNHPRILALQARILGRRGDHQTSLHILHAALKSLNSNTWNSKDEKKPYPSIATVPTLYSLCDSALELFQWETAHYIIHQTLELAPLEPRAHLNLAKLTVMKAEYQWLCEVVGVTANSPGPSARSSEARATFEQAMTDSIQYLQNLEPDLTSGENKADISKLNPIINRWTARGLVVFGNDEEIKIAVVDLTKLNDQTEGNKPYIFTDDIAALISADTRLATIQDDDKLAKMTQIARAYIQDLVVPLQVTFALSEKNSQEALKLLDEMKERSHSKNSPLFAMSRAYAATLLSNHNHFEDAKTAIVEALAVFANEPVWHSLAALIYQNVGNNVEAIYHFDEAIRLDPHNIMNHLGLGKILIENAHTDPAYIKRAIQVLERACRLEPENSEPWFYLSRAYLLMMDLDQAASYAEMAITMAPDNINLITLRGEIALHQNEFQAALEYADHALQIDGRDTQAILIKSQALRELGKTDQALEVLESAMENMEDPLTLQIEYAILLNDMRGPQTSIDALQQLVEQYPDNPKILSLLAKNMAETGQIEQSIQTAQQALRVTNGSQPNSEKADLHYLLGSLFFRTRQLDQAIFHLSESIALTPNFIDSYLELGRAQQERRQYRLALEAYQKATRIAPNDPRPHYQAGIAYKEGKDYQASEAMLRKAAELAPDDVNIRRQLAAVVALNLVHNPRSKRIVEE